MTNDIIYSNHAGITAKRIKEWEDFKKVIKERKKNGSNVPVYVDGWGDYRYVYNLSLKEIDQKISNMEKDPFKYPQEQIDYIKSKRKIVLAKERAEKKKLEEILKEEEKRKEEIKKKWKKDDLLPGLVNLCKNLIDLCNGAYGSGIDDETQAKIDELKIAFDLDLE